MIFAALTTHWEILVVYKAIMLAEQLEDFSFLCLSSGLVQCIFQVNVVSKTYYIVEFVKLL